MNLCYLGEKEGTSCSLKQSHDLLLESKTENAQLKGKLQATESQVEALQRGKDEVSNQNDPHKKSLGDI